MSALLMRPELVWRSMQGFKTQTRRLVKWMPASPGDVSATRPPDRATPYTHREGAYLLEWEEPTGVSRVMVPCPLVVGDPLVLREKVRIITASDPRDYAAYVTYEIGPGRAVSVSPAAREAGKPSAAPGLTGKRWWPAIHMPDWACRFSPILRWSEIERLQAMTESSALAEGFADLASFQATWDEINPDAPWSANPWVWVHNYYPGRVVASYVNIADALNRAEQRGDDDYDFGTDECRAAELWDEMSDDQRQRADAMLAARAEALRNGGYGRGKAAP